MIIQPTADGEAVVISTVPFSGTEITQFTFK